MNRLLLARSELGQSLPPGDRRTIHVERVLKKGAGDLVEVGILSDEPFAALPDSMGNARIEALDGSGLRLAFDVGAEAPPLHPLRLILGFPRPIQGARLLRELASLGVGQIILCGTELGEKSYLESDLWKKGDYRQALIEGAEQAGNPRLPRVSRAWTLERALDDDTRSGASETEGPDWSRGSCIVLHPDPTRALLGSLSFSGSATLAIGSERGWTRTELGLLASRGFEPASLGRRILKTETAALVASALALRGLGLL